MLKDRNSKRRFGEFQGAQRQIAQSISKYFNLKRRNRCSRIRRHGKRQEITGSYDT